MDLVRSLDPLTDLIYDCRVSCVCRRRGTCSHDHRSQRLRNNVCKLASAMTQSRWAATGVAAPTRICERRMSTAQGRGVLRGPVLVALLRLS